MKKLEKVLVWFMKFRAGRYVVRGFYNMCARVGMGVKFIWHFNRLKYYWWRDKKLGKGYSKETANLADALRGVIVNSRGGLSKRGMYSVGFIEEDMKKICSDLSAKYNRDPVTYNIIGGSGKPATAVEQDGFVVVDTNKTGG